MVTPFGTPRSSRAKTRSGALAAFAALGLLAAMFSQPTAAQAAPAPVAIDDNYSALPGATVEPTGLGVFANDTDADGASMTIKLLTNPTRGTATVTGPGLFRYEPEELFTGTDTFTYCIVFRVDPLTCLSEAATVTIDSASPTAVDDAYSTPVNTALTVSAPGVLANDAHVLAPMTAKFDPVAYGTVTAGSGGAFGYAPPPGFRGTQSFRYCVVASAASTVCISDFATVTVRVGLDGLVAVGDHYETSAGSTLTVPAATGLLANDQGVVATDRILAAQPQHGTVEVGGDGRFTYTPADGFAGSDSFDYCISAVANTRPCLSLLATVTLTVQPVAFRVGGDDRFAVSAAVSARTFAPGVAVAYVASGAVFADALSGAAAAGAAHGPVLLTTRDAVPPVVLDELRRLRPAKIVVLGGTASVGTAVEDALRPLAPSLDRYAGADRYAVSAEVSKHAFASNAPVVYVASGQNFPDALAGSAAAGHLGGPVLLVTRDSVSAEVAAELARLKPARIVVLGGPNSVSAEVLGTLAGIAPATRIGGADRFEVSANVSANTFPAGAPTVYIASGAVFPDALSGSSAAVVHSAPVLLVTATGIPAAVAAELDRLKPGRIIVLGGTNTVSDAVLAALREHLVG
ncbi:cell wall-binding repeat-containing protein [Herbiconiux sp. 11R-BC]|uniref:cell wall-binding repeat-containing protein n=1 Tax=Herbiconiux sp. 11R-BC TaxID=3111637 RepID=UPI003C07DD6D